MIRRTAALGIAAALVLTLGPVPAQAADRTPRPVIFVHGSAGSAQQFQTQAKRFASNGYPTVRIEAHEYDSTFTLNTMEQVWAGLDARIARLSQESGTQQVDLVAHSLGTFVVQGYLTSSPARAARVAHYVNLDGRTATAPPGGVPTLAIWAEGDPARTVTGATNVSLPDQSHTQSVTSAESFVHVHRFLTGRSPRTTGIQAEHRITLSGRAVLFPLNAGVPDGTLQVYELNLLGLRQRHVATVPLSGDGSWGPLRADGGRRYEFAVVRDGPPTHHFYFQPFRRSDRLVRLLTSTPGQGLGALVEAGDRHAAIVVNRNKEWWAGEDRLWVNGRDILNPANSPRAKRVIGIFAFDRGSDRTTDLTAPIPAFYAQTFITGMDVFIPAAGLTVVGARQRGADGLDVLTIPAWPSSGHRSTLNFDDFG
ncbi:lipase/acyltransferase domain-containing protein [Plantactinospora soyae]|uniref:Pimeloyl-ACP methyl ester carboxylesterase n=1 Tax=Plantactinospora soyae TaxID=1544732 RepID=A0A927MEV5_9ACTN|nr:alpha/beta hydrolase [Plantactinospora soyae]MBE1489835.1 pimeloyl-ACP methyl ester carboxylesterase [Plantactinospora soyae]